LVARWYSDWPPRAMYRAAYGWPCVNSWARRRRLMVSTAHDVLSGAW
jgi:hypothetical protein